MKLGGEAEATAWEDDGAQSPTGTHASMVPAWFCKFPGCGKGYASTDGVRKHCRKQHAEWLANLDEVTHSTKDRNRSSNYCVSGMIAADKLQRTEGADVPKRVFKKPRLARASTPTPETPALEPRTPPAIEPATAPFDPTRLWPTFDLRAASDSDDLGLGQQHRPRPLPMPSRLQSADLDAPAPPLSGCDSFFSLSEGMPVPKRGHSLLFDNMDLDADGFVDKDGLTFGASGDQSLEPVPEVSDAHAADTCFLDDVWA